MTVFKVDNGTLSQATSYFVDNQPAGVPRTISFSPDGSLVITANGANSGHKLTLFAVTNGTLDTGTTYISMIEPDSAMFSPDGTAVAVGNYGIGEAGSANVRIFLVHCDANCTPSSSSSTTSNFSSTSSASSLASDGSITSDGDGDGMESSSASSTLRSKLLYLFTLCSIEGI